MRIVAGKHRGARLAVGAGNDIRPTSDRAREGLFNILTARFADELQGASILDAFCGTGALALEALSRGAASAVLIDTSSEALAIARHNMEARGEIAQATLLRRDATRPGAPPHSCSLGFLDPPYGRELAVPALTALADQGWFSDTALVIVEVAAREALDPPPGFIGIEERRYGAARFVVLRRTPV